VGVDDAPRIYRGEPHAWRMPGPERPVSFLLAGLAFTVVLAELLLALYDIVALGAVRAGTARLFAIAGLAFIVGGSLKSLAIILNRSASQTLGGMIDFAMPMLWKLHFWLMPLGLFSLGLFLLLTPLPQSPFYHIAYGVMLWQSLSGLLAREALPVPGGRAPVGRFARAAHHQPAVYVLLTVLVVVGFVDGLFL